jgi:hypothetical protein
MDGSKPKWKIKGLARGVDPSSLVNETEEVLVPPELPPHRQGFDTSREPVYGGMGSIIRDGLADERASRRIPSGLAYLAVLIAVGLMLVSVLVTVANLIGGRFWG